MSKVILLTSGALILAAVVIVLLAWLFLLARDWFDADRALARKAKEQADDAIYEMKTAERMAGKKRK